MTNLTPEQDKALDAAILALEQSYSPYSGFCVGACVVLDDDTFVTGANVENASYGATICAERSAVVRANAECGKRLFKGIAITGKPRSKENDEWHELTAPCGVCRQVLFEMTDLSEIVRDPWVVLGTPSKGNVKVTSVRCLLPDSFGPSSLGIKLEDFRA